MTTLFADSTVHFHKRHITNDGKMKTDFKGKRKQTTPTAASHSHLLLHVDANAHADVDVLSCGHVLERNNTDSDMNAQTCPAQFPTSTSTHLSR